MSNFLEINGVQMPTSDLCGWHGAKDPELLRNEFDLLTSDATGGKIYRDFPLKQSRAVGSKRAMLWSITRKVLGQDIKNEPQAVGDCCSWGTKHAIETLQCVQMSLGQPLTFRKIFSPYLWGCARIFVGQNRLGWQDGSLGVWQAKAAMQYGAIACDDPGVPQYSAAVARKYGNRPGPPQDWVSLGKQHIVKSTSLVQTWDDLVTSICNGYPVIVCSNYGFTYKLDSQGYNARSGRWDHCMVYTGISADDDGHDCVALENSWGEQMFEQVTDFVTGEKWPLGTLRIRKEDAIGMISQGDSYAFSTSFEGFPDQELPRSLFDLV